VEATKFPRSPDPTAPRHPEESSALRIGDVRTPRGKVVLPFKHSRNPSIGNRPSAMEVAQALNEISEEKEDETPDNIPTTIPETTSPVVSLPKLRGPLPQSQAEKRKSTYERYSAMILPPLPEETASPAGTLRVVPEPLGNHREPAIPSERSIIPQNFISPIAADQHDLPKDVATGMVSNEGGNVDSVSNQVEPNVKLNDDQIADLLKPRPPPRQSEDIQTISVELLSIVGNAATVVSEPQGIFYDSEILAIVHRAKSRGSGLASTNVWCWLGRQTQLGDRADKKLQELSRRYGTSAVSVFQTQHLYLVLILISGNHSSTRRANGTRPNLRRSSRNPPGARTHSPVNWQSFRLEYTYVGHSQPLDF
jgi:hypothetical protein